MSNHFHLLLVPGRVDGLGKCLHGLTFRYAQYFNRKHHRSGQLWQNRYYSCPVDAGVGDYLWQALRYVESNPVRAEIVRRAEDWRWSSASAHVRNVPDENLSDSGLLSGQDQIEYRRFLAEAGEIKSIRQATSTGRCSVRGSSRCGWRQRCIAALILYQSGDQSIDRKG